MEKTWGKICGILTGFVTDKAQLEIISDFIDEFKDENTLVVADPVRLITAHFMTVMICKCAT
mgnify:CR=1 FL=1